MKQNHVWVVEIAIYDGKEYECFIGEYFLTRKEAQADKEICARLNPSDKFRVVKYVRAGK